MVALFLKDFLWAKNAVWFLERIIIILMKVWYPDNGINWTAAFLIVNHRVLFHSEHYNLSKTLTKPSIANDQNNE